MRLSRLPVLDHFLADGDATTGFVAPIVRPYVQQTASMRVAPPITAAIAASDSCNVRRRPYGRYRQHAPFLRVVTTARAYLFNVHSLASIALQGYASVNSRFSQPYNSRLLAIGISFLHQDRLML